jgi:hypothetical protein
MKTFKLTFFSIVMMLMVFVSCTNEESLIEEQPVTEESSSITTSLSKMSNQFDEFGNVTETDNPAGNVVFDFCFDFVYPLTLSYNNGTTVIVNSLDDLINVILSFNDDLYIDGIAFPFDVETYNESTNAIEIVTINDEDEFIALLEDCDFDTGDFCECFEVFDPVCVEITDSNGEPFMITYPNACFAECDGFTEDDFSEECGGDFETGAGECFEFVYPISIILDEGSPVTVNSRDELFNATYGAYHIDLVLPLDIITEDDSVVTINSYDELEAIIEECFGDGYGVIECSIEDITNSLVNCFWQIDFVDDDQYLYNLNSDGTYQVQSDDSLLTFGTWNIVAGNDTFYISLNADSSNFNDEWVVTECDTDNGFAYLEMQSLIYPQAELYSTDCNDGNNNLDCSNEDITLKLTECLWEIDFIDFNNFFYNFNVDGTYEVQSDNDILTTGTWVLSPGGDAVIIVLNAEVAEYNDAWLISDCDEDDLEIISLEFPQAEIYSINCD